MLTLNRRCLILPAVAILVLVYAGLVSVSSAHQAEGYQPAGAWAWSITSPNGTAPALVTFHRDGTVFVAQASVGKSSPGHGAWERTGPKSFGGTCLFMNFDSGGNFTGFMRTRSALRFVDDPDHIEGELYVELGVPCAIDHVRCLDPLGPDATWTLISVNPLPISGTRIQRVEIPEQENFPQ